MPSTYDIGDVVRAIGTFSDTSEQDLTLEVAWISNDGGTAQVTGGVAIVTGSTPGAVATLTAKGT